MRVQVPGMARRAVHHSTFDGACGDARTDTARARTGGRRVELAPGPEQLMSVQRSDDDAIERNASASAGWRGEGRTRNAGDCRFRLAALLLVVVWSLAEAPFEIASAATVSEKLVLLSSKAIVGLIALLAGTRIRWAEFVFVFICALSILAIVPGLADEMTISWSVFGWSFAECAIKAFALFAFARRRRQPSAG